MHETTHNLVASFDVQGPIPGHHDIVRIGFAVYDRQFVNEVGIWERFVTPRDYDNFEEGVISSMGLRSLEGRKDNWTPFDKTWSMAEGFITRSVGANTFQEAMSRTTWVGERPEIDLAYLWAMAQHSGVDLHSESIPRVASLQSYAYIYESIARAAGIMLSTGLDLETIAEQASVRISRKEYPVERCRAIADCFRKLIQNQKATYEEAKAYRFRTR